MEEHLLAATDLRVDVGGVPVADGLAFRTNGQRVLLLGAPQGLFEASTGLRAIVRGSLTVRGVPAAEAIATGIIAGASSAAPTPPWTVREYVEASARLARVPRSEARASAADAIARMKLEALATTATSRIPPHARRATLVAAALATYAEVIAVADPFGGLSDDAAATFADVLSTALADRAWLVFAPRLALGSPLAAAADEAIVFGASRVDGQGTPAALAASASFSVRLSGRDETVSDALAARGASIEDRGTHLVLDLGPSLTTNDLFAICAAANVAVLELVPLAQAFR